MYGIFTYIWVIYGVNVGKYSIHGSYGYIYTYNYIYIYMQYYAITYSHYHSWLALLKSQKLLLQSSFLSLLKPIFLLSSS